MLCNVFLGEICWDKKGSGMMGLEFWSPFCVKLQSLLFLAEVKLPKWEEGERERLWSTEGWDTVIDLLKHKINPPHLFGNMGKIQIWQVNTCRYFLIATADFNQRLNILIPVLNWVSLSIIFNVLYCCKSWRSFFLKTIKRYVNFVKQANKQILSSGTPTVTVGRF